MVGCWLAIPFNNWFGRRGTIFITCLFSALACFWQGFVNTWWHMFVARFALGLGIGPKSATVPIYAAECTPPEIRGALVMQWQMWTAFGIMVGYAADLAFYKVPDKHNITGLNWRIMMASAMLPAVIVCCFVFLCPESPRLVLLILNLFMLDLGYTDAIADGTCSKEDMPLHSRACAGSAMSRCRQLGTSSTCSRVSRPRKASDCSKARSGR